MHVQTFPVVVVGRIFAVGNAVIVATCSGGDAVAGAAIILVSVPGQEVAFSEEILLIGNQCAGNAVVVQFGVNDTVIFT